MRSRDPSDEIVDLLAAVTHERTANEALEKAIAAIRTEYEARPAIFPAHRREVERAKQSRPEQTDADMEEGDSEETTIEGQESSITPPQLVFLYLRADWRRQAGASETDVMNAVLNCRCCRETPEHPEVDTCPVCCPNKRVLTVALSSRSSLGPELIRNGEIEKYTFDSCRTHCSSSRDHLKSRLVLVMDSLRGLGPVVSSPFVMQARGKLVKGTYLHTLGSADRPTETCAPPAIQEPAIGVAVLSTALSPDEAERHFAHYRGMLSGMEGFLDVQWRIDGSHVVGMMSFTTPEAATAAGIASLDYLHNSNGVENLAGADLCDAGTATVLSYCCSWQSTP
eukprot:m51a1_g2394 hypothetical protein (339) ;mRNA; f:738238-739778